MAYSDDDWSNYIQASVPASFIFGEGPGRDILTEEKKPKYAVHIDCSTAFTNAAEG